MRSEGTRRWNLLLTFFVSPTTGLAFLFFVPVLVSLLLVSEILPKHHQPKLMGASFSSSETTRVTKMSGDWPPAGYEAKGHELATFAGGCFWGLELRFQRVEGVVKTSVGYIDGQEEDPSYEQVCSGQTGHTEAVQMTFDPNVVTFAELCDTFYVGHDPTTLNRQGGDRGTQYRSGIYYHNQGQKSVAEEKKAKVPNAVTEIHAAKTFWPADVYHQQYLEKGGRFSQGQSAKKGCTDPIRCYG
jgi:peptide-methionine (S)-S-oxide reductase